MVLTSPWTMQSVGQTQDLAPPPRLSLPSHQATTDNRALQMKAKRCQLCNAAGKVPSSSNQFTAWSMRFTTWFVSTYANTDLICPRYWVFLKLRPSFDLKVTLFFFFIAFTTEIVCSSELFNLSYLSRRQPFGTGRHFLLIYSVEMTMKDFGFFSFFTLSFLYSKLAFSLG